MRKTTSVDLKEICRFFCGLSLQCLAGKPGIGCTKFEKIARFSCRKSQNNLYNTLKLVKCIIISTSSNSYVPAGNQQKRKKYRCILWFISDICSLFRSSMDFLIFYTPYNEYMYTIQSSIYSLNTILRLNICK